MFCIAVMRQRARAPRVAKLTKPRPLRHRLPSIKTGPSPLEPGQATEQVKGFTPELFSVKSADEAEGNGEPTGNSMCLSVLSYK